MTHRLHLLCQLLAPQNISPIAAGAGAYEPQDRMQQQKEQHAGHSTTYSLVCSKGLQLLLDEFPDGLLNSRGQTAAVLFLFTVLGVAATRQPAALPAITRPKDAKVT